MAFITKRFVAILCFNVYVAFADFVVVDKFDESVVFTAKNAIMCSVPNENARFDCMPDNAELKTENDCKARGCCWDQTAASKVVEKHRFKAGNYTRVKKVYTAPRCYFPSNYNGYYVKNITKTSFGLTVMLKRDTFSPWPKDILNLQMDIYMETSTRVHFKVQLITLC